MAYCHKKSLYPGIFLLVFPLHVQLIFQLTGLLLKIENKEDTTEALNEYKKMVESLHFDLIYKECPNCEQQFYPNEYLTHIKTCSLRKSLTFESHHESEYKEDNVIEYVRDRCQRKRRKMSMENLKSIAKDEVKSFKSFNILRYKNKEQL